MLIKTFSNTAWDFGIQAANLIKIASGHRLVGADLQALVKRGSAEFADQVMRNVKMAEGEVPLHLIAMGATEGYGPNRNGDGFKEAALKAYCSTFVKYGRHYRHHKNKDQSISYGIPKLAWYNPQMRRVELLVALNGTKEAAEKNGGFIADKELDRLNSGKDLPVSMACKVAYDVCSACGNQAPTRDDYCKSAEEGGECSLFGCTSGLTKVAEDGHIQHVDNPHPTFFDISSVFRNADRIAFGSLADYMQKAASEGFSIGGAALAELWGVVPPLSLRLDHLPGHIAEQVKLAYALASIEDDIAANPNTPQRQAFARSVDVINKFAAVDVKELGTLGSVKMASGLAALASQKIALPLREFVCLCTGEDSVKSAALTEQVSGLLPGIYNRLITGGNLESEISSNPFKPSRGLAPATQRQWASKYAATHSLDRYHSSLRSQFSAIRNMSSPTLQQPTTKRAAQASGEAERLARRYALYKLAFLAAQTDEVPLTSELVVCQNHVG